MTDDDTDRQMESIGRSPAGTTDDETQTPATGRNRTTASDTPAKDDSDVSADDGTDADTSRTPQEDPSEIDPDRTNLVAALGEPPSCAPSDSPDDERSSSSPSHQESPASVETKTVSTNYGASGEVVVEDLDLELIWRDSRWGDDTVKPVSQAVLPLLLHDSGHVNTRSITHAQTVAARLTDSGLLVYDDTSEHNGWVPAAVLLC